MGDPGTDTLRKLAPSWTLAGDEQLLNILQSTHQRLLSKCQEANSQLEQMATVLNDASVSLQNVNNQFMALSSSQFIESRVYDDDDVVTDAPAPKEPPMPELPDELASLKRSIAVLEEAHEIITILHDSDTESDSDDEMPARMVLKPKDMYADRPLPYIIGSQPWKNKWHAGLLLEDSDSESSASKVEHDSDQYSQSEPEDTHTDKLRVPDTHTTVSETSSELPSEQGSVPKPTPSDVASEIARRLGAREPPKMVERDPVYEEPVTPAVRKIYRPQDPVSSTIFPDEPPPLSEQSDSQESDIFADLHRSQPFASAHLTDDLFGFNNDEGDSDEGDIFSDFAKKPVTDPSAKPTSLFDAGPTPHMFDKHRHDYDRSGHDHSIDHSRTHVSDRSDTYQTKDDGTKTVQDNEKGVKKPVGGISLFGNKGTESIGAAILKRNQRKSSTSGDESGSDSRSEHIDQQIKKEKDIFDDLFARSEGKKISKDKVDVAKDIKTEIQKKNVEKSKDIKVEKPKVDLFSDNLFDDIDDIFSTNVVKIPPKDNSKTKPIFEDDDDLFSEIAAPKPMQIEVANSSSNKKSIFDSDDELFSESVPKPDEKPKTSPKPSKTSQSTTKPSELPKISKDITRSIFDDDEDDLFSDVTPKTQNEVNKVQNTSVSLEKSQDFSKSDEKNTNYVVPPAVSSQTFKSPSLFDDDDDESDLFAEPAKSSNSQKIEAEKPSSKIQISEENIEKITDVNPPSQVKTDDLERNIVKNNNINLFKEGTKSIISVNEIVDNSESINSIEESNSVVPVRDDVDRKNFNIINETTAAKTVQNIDQSSSDTNNDFSDQDFDDLPPKIEENNKMLTSNTNIATEAKSDKVPTDKQNIFDKNTLDDDIFAKPEQKPEEIFKDIETDSQKTEPDNKTDQIATKSIEPDIFSDILTEPPVFEKPKEPKKSKNVNALFDDDSDDESLFFKKNDPIFDENPVKFTSTQDRLFGLFTDEPPDDGFSKINDDLDDDMFSTLPKPKIPQNDNIPPIPDVNFEDNPPPIDDNKIPVIGNTDPLENIFDTGPVVTEKSTVGIKKDPAIDTQKNSTEDIFKISKTVDTEQRKSISALLDDEQLFKPTNKSNTTSQELNISDDENLFTAAAKSVQPSLQPPKETIVPENNNLATANKSSDDEIFSSSPKTEIPKPKNDIVKQDSGSDEDLFKIPKTKPEIKPRSENTDLKVDKSETKKVGKLKVGLNINVNALLPGASPKKVKPNDQTDGQTQSVTETQKSEPKIIPESPNSESQNTDSKLLKSVSFDGKPESEVLDNKLSKERARIQVKRRPSTRKARREAVRKSGIDFGEDSTDNSSSIDDPPRIPPGKQPESSKNTAEDGKEQNEIIQNVETIDNTKVDSKPDERTIKAETQPNLVEKQPTIQPDNIDILADITEKPSYSRDVKSKVVYILNDEDIFNTSPEKPESMNKKSENLDSKSGVTTLGKVYHETKSDDHPKKHSKSSLFGDDNDDEIFKTKTVVKKTSIFDSDSEEDLFGNKKEVKKEIKREIVKGPLFGDEDDDDDLFGVKTKKRVEQKPQPSRSLPKETPKPAEPVFEDPLSMFGDDD